ncbi:MAG: penicillin-binding protein activator [Sphingomonadales bacterium]|nr:penicillin-binding protein activator [Sphingomonadales bacterium]MDE2570647.1 penicillin-binding protein activator [Sphingomonadales bacterium]
MAKGELSRQALVGRRLVVGGALALLAGCQVIPKGAAPVAPPPPPRPVETGPRAGVLPTDTLRHRIALLVPLSGPNASVGQSIANAATMALLDTNATNLRITTYDTAAGAETAARKAIADGNRLILGPLLSDNVVKVASVARPAKVPMITYSNDVGVADRDVFVLGQAPGQAVARVIGYAKAHGVNRVAALIPTGIYGQRASSALIAATRAQGVAVSDIETYDRSPASLASAVRQIKTKGGAYDAVLIADGARIAVQAGPLIGPGPRLLGTELWSGEATVARSPALRGAWFAAVSDARWPQFQQSYRSRFGGAPSRLATLGYDSVLLTLNVAREWKPGSLFPTGRLYDKDGFIGLDGVFRFASDGVAERAMDVREVANGTFAIVSPAPSRF